MRYKNFVVFTALALPALTHLSAVAQTCPDNVPHITGTWTVLPYQMPISPISATLLPNGKVLIVAGSENDRSNNSEGAESYRAAVWDPSGNDESSISVHNLSYDIFCSGTAALFDGRSLIVGGTLEGTHYNTEGENRASIFNPVTNQFVQSQNMVDGRWYGTATALADGRIMAMSGLNQTGGISRKIEIYDLQLAGAGWNPPTSAPFTPTLYPRLHLLPGGRVFYTGHGTRTSNANAWIFDPATGGWTQSATTTRNRRYGSSVLLPLLPPSYVPRVMNFGGGANPATSSTDIIDLSVATPRYTAGPNMSTGRVQMNAVILPNGKVLAEGGSVIGETPDTPGKTADLYDPVSNTMSSAGTAAFSRLYHSTALLLPDATVVSMDSNPTNPRGRYEPAIEIYTPSYLYDSNDHLITTNRPRITGLSFSGPIHYGMPFSVSYTSTSPISSAVLIRLGSSTHAFDMEQRLIDLCGDTSPCTASSNTLSLTTPPDGSIAPPGYYMLFLLDSAGVPSKARFIQLTPNSYSLVPPSGEITTPSGDMTITAGSAINFGTNTSAANYSWVFPGGSPATSTARNPGNVTFSTYGMYTVSLTVIDATGNSDPNPPTRTIEVLPTSPDFDITVSPAAQEVVPGGLTTYTVTVTPESGFMGTVNLSVGSENGFPPGITSGGFSPPSITAGGSSTLTMQTSTATVPYALSLTITGTSGTITHTASTTLLVNLAPPAGLTAVAGDAQVSLSWPASVGANGYHVKRGRVDGGPYETFACPGGTSVVDTGLVNGTTYYYTVSAAYTGGQNGGGESADSVQVSAMPMGNPPPTPTPTPTPTPGSFAAVILATEPANLKGYWKCNETSGTTLVDSSGNSKNLTLHGVAGTAYSLAQSGEQGASIRFYGTTNSYADRSDSPNSILGSSNLQNNNWTMFALVKGNTQAAGAASVMGLGNSGTAGPFVDMDSGPSLTKIRGLVRNNDFSYTVNFEGGTVFNSIWHSVVFRRNGTNFHIFVDGVIAGTFSGTPTITNAIVATSLGKLIKSGVQNPSLNGYIQHAAIWNTALSNSEIMAIQTARTVNPTPSPTPTATPTHTPGSFAAVILATEPANLKGYWKCNETSGTTLVDSSGNSKNLTLHGVAGTAYSLAQPGEQGASIRFYGTTNSYADRSDSPNSILGSSNLQNSNWTMFALVKGNTQAAGAASVMGLGNSATAGPFVAMDSGPSLTKIRAQIRNNDFSYTANFEGGTVFNSIWHSVVFRRNGTNFHIFVDGVIAGTFSGTPTITNAIVATSLGKLIKSGAQNPSLNGYIQHAAIWNRALSDSEIMAIQTARTVNPTPSPTPTATPTPAPGSFAAVILATEPANLKGYWKCNETSGTTLADSSGNSKNLTITGAINTNYFLGESGEQGRCFRTDGVAGYASRNDAVIPSLDNTNFTLFALVKGGTDFNNGAVIISHSGNELSRATVAAEAGTERALANARGNGLLPNPIIAGGTAFDGNWHSITYRRTGTAFELFVDGTRVASTTATFATGSVLNRTSLMYNLSPANPPARHARGSIQHAAIWNRALSDSEIMAIQTAR